METEGNAGSSNASCRNLQESIPTLSDTELQAPVKLFGRDTTKFWALNRFVNLF
jgi:hypothetical protein